MFCQQKLKLASKKAKRLPSKQAEPNLKENDKKSTQRWKEWHMFVSIDHGEGKFELLQKDALSNRPM